MVGSSCKQQQRRFVPANEKARVMLEKVYVSTLHMSDVDEARAHKVLKMHDVSVVRHHESKARKRRALRIVHKKTIKMWIKVSTRDQKVILINIA